jgi:hypothetical protein
MVHVLETLATGWESQNEKLSHGVVQNEGPDFSLLKVEIWGVYLIFRHPPKYVAPNLKQTRFACLENSSSLVGTVVLIGI